MITRQNNLICKAASLFLLLAGFVAIPAMQPTYAQDGPDEMATSASTEAKAIASLQMQVKDVIARTQASVVAVSRLHTTQRQHSIVPTDPFSRFRLNPKNNDPTDSDFIPTAYGAGVVIDAKGLILTHTDLVALGDLHWVTLHNRKSYVATIVAADPRSGLAVLSIEKHDLPAISLAQPTPLTRGQFVLSLGNPHSLARDGQASASWGLIANTGRKSRMGNSTQRVMIHEYGGLIQTDTKPSIGTSGGPLLNLQGEMIGLASTHHIGTGNQEVSGFAIPVDELFHRAIEKLLQGGEVEYGFLGVRWFPTSSKSEPKGVRISDVVRGTPAHKAGLRGEDIVSSVNGKEIADTDALVYQIGRLSPGATANLKVLRRGKQIDLEVTLTKGPWTWSPIVTQPRATWRGLIVDYATASEKFRYSAANGLLDVKGCVLIREVEAGSPAWKAELNPGMYISHVNGERVQTPDEFEAATAKASGPVEICLTLPENQQPVRVLQVDE